MARAARADARGRARRSIASRSSCRCRSSRRSTSSTRPASTRSSPSTRRPRARSSRARMRSSGCSPRAQGGKASEKKALQSIRDEGKRVLGVLNKADQLLGRARPTRSSTFIGGELGELVEAIVPFSARHALAHKRGRAQRRRQLERARDRARGAVLPAGAPAQARCLCPRCCAASSSEAQGSVARLRARARPRQRRPRAPARDELTASARDVRRCQRVFDRAQGAVGVRSRCCIAAPHARCSISCGHAGSRSRRTPRPPRTATT